MKLLIPTFLTKLNDTHHLNWSKIKVLNSISELCINCWGSKGVGEEGGWENPSLCITNQSPLKIISMSLLHLGLMILSWLANAFFKFAHV